MPPSLINQLTSQETPLRAEPSQSNISNGTAELLCLVSLLFLVALVIWMVVRSRAASRRGTTGEASVGEEDSGDHTPRGPGGADGPGGSAGADAGRPTGPTDGPGGAAGQGRGESP